MITELIKNNRSFRRFDAERKISEAELLSMIESARCSASAANRQRIRFALVNSKQECDRMFSSVAFAGYLKEWGGPSESERPTAYIVMMSESESVDTPLAMDVGIAAQSILLTAVEMGLGGCMILSFKRENVESIVNKDGFHPALVIALGKPAERVYLTDVKDGNIKYYRDENDCHAVPKYSLDELIL